MNAYDICCRALRRIGILGAGQTPDPDMLSDAIDTLSAILQREVTEAALGDLIDVFAEPGTHEAEEWTRIYRDDVETTAVNLPLRVAERCGSERSPHGGAVVQIADKFLGTTTTYIFDSHAKNWLPIEPMEAASAVPLAAGDALGISAYLAVELSAEYGQPLDETTIMAAQRWKNTVSASWWKARRPDPRPEAYF